MKMISADFLCYFSLIFKCPGLETFQEEHAAKMASNRNLVAKKQNFCRNRALFSDVPSLVDVFHSDVPHNPSAL